MTETSAQIAKHFRETHLPPLETFEIVRVERALADFIAAERTSASARVLGAAESMRERAAQVVEGEGLGYPARLIRALSLLAEGGKS